MPRVYRRRRSRSTLRSRKRYGRRRVYSRRKSVRRFRRRGTRKILGGFPKVKTVKFNYEDQRTSWIIIKANEKFVYRVYELNNAFDIDPQVNNNTLTGYTRWSTVYNKALVTWAKMTVTFVSDTVAPRYVGLLFRPITAETTLSTWADWRNIPGNNWIQKQYLLGGKGQKNDSVTLSIKAPLWRVWGNKRQYYGDLDFTHNTDAGPSRQIEGIIYGLNPFDAILDNDAGIYVKVRLQVYVRFSGLKFYPNTLVPTAGSVGVGNDVISNPPDEDPQIPS